ncbi:MAG: MlaD family protein [Burkholderiaceae bacterium]|jgi:phospholipid/cholesterol/gamma-HCH transport system substrate-binding protein|nr:MlaD family protein [Burkholderiaceae bacterium]
MSDEPTPALRTSESLELRAALLVGLLLLLVAAAGVYLLYARGVFEPSQRLVLLSDDAEGITVGMDLTFAGFPIGRVRRIELSAEGATRIVIDVPRKDARWLRESSVFTLTRGLVGNTNLRAFSGVLSDPPLADGAERRVLVGDATAEIPRLVSETRDLIANLTQLTKSDSALAAALGNVQNATERIKGPRGALGVLFGNDADAQKLVTALDRTNALLARIDGLAVKADQQVFGAQGLMPEARAAVVQLNSALLEARESLKKIDAILVDAQAIAGNARSASNDLAALRSEVDANLRKVSGMIDELNRRWPFAKPTEIKLP